MHILLTRPLEDCAEMILKFQSLGHEISHLPLLYIEPVKYEKVEFSDYKGIIFTSANALKNLDVRNIDKKILCFCVGSATEKKAKISGFQNIFTADGNVLNLKEVIFKNFEPKNGKLIYVSGEIVTANLEQQLLNEGYEIKRIINYSSKPNMNFNQDFIKELTLKIPDIVYIYSQNSALSFLNFIKNNNLENLWMDTNLMCISEKCSSILNLIKWKKIFLFNPGEEEFLLYKI